MISNIILDVDGTIWDSAPQVTNAWNEVLAAHRDLTDLVLTVDDTYSQMGKTMTDIAHSLFPSVSEADRARLMDECMSHENEYLSAHPGVIYPGLEDTLRAMILSRTNPCRFYIVSNCQEGYIEAMLANKAMAELITDYDCFGRTKLPKGDTIRILMERNHLRQNTCLYLGDTRMDEIAADRAGIPFIHASYGFGSAQHPAAVISDIRELPEAVRRLAAPAAPTVPGN